jgi:hypothetical protein
MSCKNCGSYAINHHLHGRDGTSPDLCDVCYWRQKTANLFVSGHALRRALVATREGLGCGCGGDHGLCNRCSRVADEADSALGVKPV